MKKFLLLLLPVTLLLLAVSARAADDSRVWVVFKAGQKGLVKAQIQNARGQVHYEFDDLRAIATTLPEAALNGLRNNPNVELVEDDPPRYMFGQTVPYGVDLVQARAIWDANSDSSVDPGAPNGDGIVVGVIDSGVYTAHADLSGVRFLGGYDGTGSAGGWYSDLCGHGTHVVGTIAAANNGLGVVGVTPGTVSIFMVKVFGDDCGWAYSSTLVDAAQRCKNAGAKVISMSLGGSMKSVTEDRAFKNLYNAGILSVAAAGNDGNSQFSYPASYSSVISVAAVDQSEVVASFSQKNNQVELAAPGVGVLSTVSYATPTVTVGVNDYPAGQIELAASGTAEATLVDGERATSAPTKESGIWYGKVVLVERGDNTFNEKVQNVQNAGGVAAVIYNNVPGGFSGTLGDGNSSSIPAVSITREDGLRLKLSELGQSARVAIPAPGTSGSGYAYYDGTSMATPHVSAVAALLWSSDSTLSNAKIRDALQKSAKDLGAAGKDNSYGYGLVQAKDALALLDGGSPPPTGTLVVAISTDKGSYINRQTVTVTTTITDGTSTVVGAAVHLVLTTANGSQVGADTTSDTNGKAMFTYKVNSNREGVGTYTAAATATKSGYNSGTGSATFEVTK